MKIAVLIRNRDAFSLRLYTEKVTSELATLGVEIVPFTPLGPIPKLCDLVWDPAQAGSRVPSPILKRVHKPLVVTVHGAAPFNMNWREYYPHLKAALRGALQQRLALAAWRWFRSRITAVIAVSTFGAQEVAGTFGLSQDQITPIYHGVAHETFQARNDPPAFERPYLLLVAQYQPKKNIARVLEAYAQLRISPRPDMVMVLPGYSARSANVKGFKLIGEGLPPSELARWYRGALGFVFPSLRETFGMPILEAMACGCPVITSNLSACPEVAGDAALLVDPRSVAHIAQAMRRLLVDETLRQTLCQKGLARAGEFTWRRSAERHLAVFERALNGA